ncbi:hypothetical protein O6H91_05G113600 [Diphasiastrum complanatum]|uniref:Uncharacterized protein n=1 Tax=Diphasiastrum complanatum TaxID=34168 RepID=A0ACC2DSE9_DIPCM|nr:hypothetical protein O6H91_Y382800 [Diphasiastrum complanatum]KAJ7557148.1 hypothetical protein O6H91_05G113600 [Diphasiastrum complanatum]
MAEAQAEKPVNFWGDLPEEEYYKSQGVKHSAGYFKTPNGQIFTNSFLPLDAKPKGIVCLTHGYGGDTSWMFQIIAINYAQWGYAAFAADLLGHGRSDGIHGYVWNVHKLAETALSYFQSVRDSEEYKGLPAFLFGESMGGALTLLMHFQDPQGWDGAMLTAPLIIMPEAMKPSWVLLTAYSFLLGFADTWAVMPENNIVRKAIRDPAKGKVIGGNPKRYTGKPRVGTMRELRGLTIYLQQNLEKVTIPFLVMHGTDDVVTDPQSSQVLFDKASSKDKSLKFYEGAYHSLIQGEPDETKNAVLRDMREWVDQRTENILNSRSV